jgi:hypothetical protein
MTRQEAEFRGWTFKASGADVVAEKGRLIHMGTLKHVLMMIKMLGA